MPKVSEKYTIGYEQGWTDALDYVLTVLNEEVDYQEESITGTTHTASAIYRIIRIMDHRRKEWMLSGDQ